MGGPDALLFVPPAGVPAGAVAPRPARLLRALRAGAGRGWAAGAGRGGVGGNGGAAAGGDGGGGALRAARRAAAPAGVRRVAGRAARPRRTAMSAGNYATAEGQSVEEVFSDRRLYYLPGYQRNYSWEGERAAEFLHAICERVRASPPDGPAPPPVAKPGRPPAGGHPPVEAPEALRTWLKAQRPMHLNFIVLFSDPDQDGKRAIVDGQQRLITLCFVLAALRELFLASSDPQDQRRADDLHALVWQRVRGATCDAESPRVLVRPLDRELFRQMTLTCGNTEDYLDAHNTKQNKRDCMQAHRLMMCAQEEVLKKLRGEPLWVLRRLAGYVMSKCCLGAIITKERWTAQELFSVLNFRGGLQLEPIDRFRSGLIIAQEKLLADRELDEGDPFFDSALGLANGSEEAVAPPLLPMHPPPLAAEVVASATAQVVSFERLWDDLELEYGRSLLTATVLYRCWSELGYRAPSGGAILSVDRKEAPEQFAVLAGRVVRDSAAALQTPQAYLDTTFRRRLALHQMVDRASFPDALPPGPPGTVPVGPGGGAARINHLLSLLQLYKHDRWMPAVLEWFLARGADVMPLSAEDAAAAVTFLTALDRATFVFSVLPQGVTRMVTVMADVLDVIKAGGDPVPKLDLSGGDMSALEAVLLSRKFGTKAYKTIVLQRVEEALLSRSRGPLFTDGPAGGPGTSGQEGARAGGGSGSLSGPALLPFPKLSVEHVLPVAVPPGSEWARLFSEGDREVWTECLGNLTLLSKSSNSAASNGSFRDKAEQYRQSEGATALALTADVLKQQVWDVPAVAARQQRLVGVLMERFGPTAVARHPV